ncbi:hypothetical protein D3C86_1465610 [compost metagenome]
MVLNLHHTVERWIGLDHVPGWCEGVVSYLLRRCQDYELGRLPPVQLQYREHDRCRFGGLGILFADKYKRFANELNAGFWVVGPEDSIGYVFRPRCPNVADRLLSVTYVDDLEFMAELPGFCSGFRKERLERNEATALDNSLFPIRAGCRVRRCAHQLGTAFSEGGLRVA